MSEDYFALTTNDKRDALEVAANNSGRPAFLLEKDVWVVSALDALFTASFGQYLTFKGGTSLSKCYDVIRRFSEDVDITYDIRALLPSETGTSDGAIPQSPSAAAKWRKKAKHRLYTFVEEDGVSALRSKLTLLDPEVEVSSNGDRIFVKYKAVMRSSSSYIRDAVQIEFGASSTGAPSQTIRVTCYAAARLPSVTFPTATPNAMKAERTFWEKATAAHVFTVSGRMRGERYARHFHDLVMLDKAGYAQAAAQDRLLALAVATHKNAFFREKNSAGEFIDYVPVVSGSLHLVPAADAREQLEEDYERMREGLLEDQSLDFDTLMTECGRLATMVNSLTARGTTAPSVKQQTPL